MRVTFIVADSSPLKLGTRPHPSEATHIGTRRKNETESQAPGLGVYHKLVAVMSTVGNNLGVLKKVIEDRGKVRRRALSFVFTLCARALQLTRQ